MNELQRMLQRWKRELDRILQQKSGGEKQGPSNLKMCPICGKFVSAGDKICAYCEAELEPKAPRFVSLKRGNSEPVVDTDRELFNPVMIIFGICVTFYLASLLFSTKLDGYNLMEQFFGPAGSVLDRMGGNHQIRVFREGQFWRLLTYNFLHGNIMHIFFNLSALAQLGPLVLMAYGVRRFWVITFLTGMGGGLLSALGGLGFSIGFSGVLFGYLGIGYVFFKDMGQFELAERLKKYMIWGNVICIGLTVLNIFHVDNLAHIGGMLTGLALGRIYLIRSVRFLKPIWEQILLGLLVAGWGYGILKAMILLKSGFA